MAEHASRALIVEAAQAHWRQSVRTVVLDTDFQQGQNFLALWRAFQIDQAVEGLAVRNKRLHVIAMLAHALTREQLLGENGAADHSALLAEAWPSLTPGFHTLSFDDGQVQLLLCYGNAERHHSKFVGELVAQVDVFFVHGQGHGQEHGQKHNQRGLQSMSTATLFEPFALSLAKGLRKRRQAQLEQDGSHAKSVEPESADALRMAKATARLASKNAVLVCDFNAAQSQSIEMLAWQSALISQGFALQAAPSETHTIHAKFAPRFAPKRAAARPRNTAFSTRHAVIVGAGLAGSSAAWALAQQGWTSTVLERHASIAHEASGNAAGLFHGVIHAEDGLHARFNRAASMEAAKAVRVAIAKHGADGAADGLLRLEADLSLEAMCAVLAHCGLPASYAQAINAAQVSALSQLNLQQNAWLYGDGGWVQPAALVRSYLERAGHRCQLRTDCSVETLQRSERGWQLLNAQGQTVEDAEVVVLANAFEAARLLANVSPQTLSALQKVRGQISQLPSNTAGLPNTRLPLTGAGYLLPSWQGHTLFGATSQPGDDDPAVRENDHATNLAQLAKLTQIPSVLSIDSSAAQGRTAWRCVAPDRLPVIGGVPETNHKLLDQPRLIPRLPGLFVYTALGSRGITWSALGAQVLAAWVTGAPMPIEASLLDAIDPARFAARTARGLPRSSA